MHSRLLLLGLVVCALTVSCSRSTTEVIAHGRFSRRGFAQAILRAHRAVLEDLTGSTQAALAAAGALREAPASARAASLPPTS